jgi:hypothetical protein
MGRGERGGREGGIEKIEGEGPGGGDIFLNASIFVSVFCGVDTPPLIFLFTSCPPFDLRLHQPPLSTLFGTAEDPTSPSVGGWGRVVTIHGDHHVRIFTLYLG